MTRAEAQTIATGNVNAFLIADFRSMMGQGKRPDPRFYGISGTTEKPGNMITIGGHSFSIDEIAKPTAPIHAGI